MPPSPPSVGSLSSSAAEVLSGPQVSVSRRVSISSVAVSPACRRSCSRSSSMTESRSEASGARLSSSSLSATLARSDACSSGAIREAIASRIAPLEQASERARVALRELEESLAPLASERDSVMDELREQDRRQAGLTATLEILTRLETETWGPLNTSAALLESDPTDGGLGGMLASKIKIDPKHETAINSYIGPWLCGIIARDTNAIIVAIEHL